MKVPETPQRRNRPEVIRRPVLFARGVVAVVESLFIVGVVAGVVALVVVGKRRGWMVESDDASVEQARSHGRYFGKDTSAGL